MLIRDIFRELLYEASINDLPPDVVKGPDGKPLVVYRGEHGKSPTGKVQTRLGSISFGSEETANYYANSPNNKEADSYAENPRVLAAYISIKKPLVNTPDDPFIDFTVLSDAIGFENAANAFVKHQRYVLGTNNWDENFSSDFNDVSDLYKRQPDRMSELYMNVFPILDDVDIVKQLVAKGYDGAIHDGYGQNSGEPEYKVFSEDQIYPVQDYK